MRDQLRHAIAPIDAVPEGKEEEVDGFCAEESDDEDEGKTGPQIMKEQVYGERKSSRAKKQAAAKGYMLNSSQLKFS